MAEFREGGGGRRGGERLRYCGNPCFWILLEIFFESTTLLGAKERTERYIYFGPPES